MFAEVAYDLVRLDQCADVLPGDAVADVAAIRGVDAVDVGREGDRTERERRRMGQGRALPVEHTLDVRGAAVEAVDRSTDDVVGPDTERGAEVDLDQSDGPHRGGVGEHQRQVEVREEHVGGNGVQDRAPDG